MEKVVFDIPNTESINIYNYKQIGPNLYRFNTEETYIYDDINIRLSIDLFKKCIELFSTNTSNSIKYETYINLSLLLTEINGKHEEIETYYKKSIDTLSDRAEPYYYWAIYCNKHKQFEKSYDLLKLALSLKYEDCVIKYPKTQRTAYDKYLYDEMAVSCYWLKKYNESKYFLEQIIDDPDFSGSRDRLLQNLQFTNEGLENM